MRRLRFRLRHLLVLVAVLAPLLAWCGKQAHDARKQRELIALVQRCGGENYHNLNFPDGTERGIKVPVLNFSPTLPGPNWVRRWLGEEYFVSVAEAFFDKPSTPVLDDAMFARFSDALRTQNLPRPQGLVFADLPITDATIRRLAEFPDLTSLHLLNCPGVTDAGLKTIGALMKLRRLNLQGASIADQGLASLNKLNDLREISLADTGVTDAGLAFLEPLKKLEWVALSRTSVTNDGRERLQEQLPTCRIVW